ADMATDSLGAGAETGDDLFGRGNGRLADAPKQLSGLLRDGAPAGGPRRRPKKLPDADGAPRRDGLVGGSDSAQRCSDLRVAGGAFARGVEEAMVGKDHRGAVRNHEVVADRDPPGLELVDFLQGG